MIRLRRTVALLSLALLLGTSQTLPAWATNLDERQRLERGDVVLEGSATTGETKFVSANILIDAPPDAVWEVVANPYEFQKHVDKRLKRVEMLMDKPEESKMRLTIDCGFLPRFHCDFENHYTQDHRLEFRRTGGMFKDMQGVWTIAPVDGGTRTVLGYKMYIDLGFYLPQWLIKECVKLELPSILKKVRTRVNAVNDGSGEPVSQTIAAATYYHPSLPPI